jgi:dolichol-phosphate mannosyltransferase
MAKGLILIPTYNERENIQILLPILRKEFPSLDVLVVDDNSPDGSWEIVKEFSEKDPGVKLLLRENKEGLGKALFAGYSYAVENDYSILIQMDADFSHPPEYIRDIIKNLRNDNIVICSRYLEVEASKMEDKRMVSKLANWVARTMVLNRVKDPSSGFRGYPISFLEKVVKYKPLSSGYFLQVEMVMLAFKFGYLVEEIPFIYRKRKYGESKLGIKEGLLALPVIVRLLLRRYY